MVMLPLVAEVWHSRDHGKTAREHQGLLTLFAEVILEKTLDKIYDVKSKPGQKACMKGCELMYKNLSAEAACQSDWKLCRAICNSNS
jgi:hypothetical protein